MCPERSSRLAVSARTQQADRHSCARGGINRSRLARSDPGHPVAASACSDQMRDAPDAACSRVACRIKQARGRAERSARMPHQVKPTQPDTVPTPDLTDGGPTTTIAAACAGPGDPAGRLLTARAAASGLPRGECAPAGPQRRGTARGEARAKGGPPAGTHRARGAPSGERHKGEPGTATREYIPNRRAAVPAGRRAPSN